MPTETMTETTPLTLEQKMVEIRKRCGYVQKDATNGGQGYTYASAEAVLSKVREAANEHAIMTQSNVSLVHMSVEEGVTIAAVHMTLVFSDGSGAKVVFQGLGQGKDKGDKAVMKANTAALKYALASGLLISWGDDPEADASTDKDTPPTSKRGGGRKSETTKTMEAIRELLKEASPDMPHIKGMIKDKLTRGSKEYTTMVAEYTAREKELTAATAGAN